MIRKIIHIDKEKCNGCGACAQACHEGAIAMANGKATLLRDDYCDGLGDCLPTCPTGAITFVEREALPYNETIVKGTNGGTSRGISEDTSGGSSECTSGGSNKITNMSALSQWPVQIKLTPINAPCYDNADLLIAADCTAYAYANFHRDFIAGRITLIGCPKLDATDYAEKLTEIIRNNKIHSITVTRMEVPCCRGIEIAVKKSLEASGKSLPLNIQVIGTDGRLL